MGAHYGTIHVLTEDRDEVKRAVEALRAKRTKRFLIAPPIDGWVAVFPENNGQDNRAAEALAKKLPGKTILCTLVHDDDIFAYWYYENGALKDRYNSCPNYFDDNNTDPRGGNAQAFAGLLKDAKKIPKLQALLDAKSMTFESERLEKFAKLLNLPNAVTAYEYLQGGERDDIQQWKQFIHVPDLTAERAEKKAAKEKTDGEQKQMQKDGLLLAEKEAPKKHPTTPMWCVDTSNNSVLLSWMGNSMAPETSTPLMRVAPLNGNETPTAVNISSHAYSMAASPTGRLIAVGCASGDWKAEIWKVADGKRIAEIPQSRAVNGICFSADERALFSVSEQYITVVNLKDLSRTKTIELFGAGKAMVLHPDGEHLAVEVEGFLVIVHLPTAAVVRSIWILAPPGPERALLEKFGSQISNRFLKTLGPHMSSDELEKQKARQARHFLPKQGVFSLGFDPAGEFILCGTNAGVCVFNWEKVLASPEMGSLTPDYFAEAESSEKRSGHRLIYAVLFDAPQRRVLFSGLEGKIRYLDLNSGKTGDLLASPLRWPFWCLQLLPDRSALIGSVTHFALRNEEKCAPKFQIWSYPALCRAAKLSF